MMDSRLENLKQELIDTINQIYSVAQQGDVKALEKFHLYGPNFTRMDHDGTRMTAEETRAGETEMFSTQGLDFQFEIVDPKVDILTDQVAVVTYYLYYTADTGVKYIQSRDYVTFVMLKDGQEWKIAHENFSYLPNYPVISRT